MSCRGGICLGQGLQANRRLAVSHQCTPPRLASRHPSRAGHRRFVTHTTVGSVQCTGESGECTVHSGECTVDRAQWSSERRPAVTACHETVWQFWPTINMMRRAPVSRTHRHQARPLHGHTDLKEFLVKTNNSISKQELSWAGLSSTSTLNFHGS